MKKHLMIFLAIIASACLLFSCKSSDDCKCAATDYTISSHTSEDGGEVTVTVVGQTRNFIFSDWNKQCDSITLQDFPEKWASSLADSCIISCSDK